MSDYKQVYQTYSCPGDWRIPGTQFRAPLKPLQHHSTVYGIERVEGTPNCAERGKSLAQPMSFFPHLCPRNGGHKFFPACLTNLYLSKCIYINIYEIILI